MATANGDSPEELTGPEFARRVVAIAASAGATKLGPGAAELLCEAAHGHATLALEAAVGAARHSGRPGLDVLDLRVGAAVLRSRAPAPPGSVDVAELARQHNCDPLPQLVPGVPLPGDAALAAMAGDVDVEEDESPQFDGGLPPWMVQEPVVSPTSPVVDSGKAVAEAGKVGEEVKATGDAEENAKVTENNAKSEVGVAKAEVVLAKTAVEARNPPAK